jgi:hypothetical protein
VIAFKADGSTFWTQPDTTKVHCGYDHPVIGDVDQDGTPEVLVGWTLLDGATGAIKMEIDPAHSWGQKLMGLADVDGDGLLDVTNGIRRSQATAPRSGTSPAWSPTAIHAVGDFDLDGSPEVVIISSGGPHTMSLVRSRPQQPDRRAGHPLRRRHQQRHLDQDVLQRRQRVRRRPPDRRRLQRRRHPRRRRGRRGRLHRVQRRRNDGPQRRRRGHRPVVQDDERLLVGGHGIVGVRLQRRSCGLARPNGPLAGLRPRIPENSAFGNNPFASARLTARFYAGIETLRARWSAHLATPGQEKSWRRIRIWMIVFGLQL